jgi:hypothetical protein
MDQARKDDIRRRLKAAAALMASDNPHEAENAARAVQAIMRQYHMDEGDILIAKVEECRSPAGAAHEPAEWERMLARMCAQGYGCRLIFIGTWSGKGQWAFIGMTPASQLASYAFDALLTKGKRDRRRYISESLKRFRKAANKQKAADAYSIGWVHALTRILPPQIELTQNQEAAIERFVEEKHGELGTMKSPKRGKIDARHASSGLNDGSQVDLHPGVREGGRPKMIGVEGG